MFFFYMIATIVWVHQMRKYKDNTISLHCHFCILILLTCIECAITFIEYNVYNDLGRRKLPLTVLSVLFFALRDTVGHLVCLLVSLGYGIVMSVLNRYSTKIGLLSFLFFIAVAINQSSFYVHQIIPFSVTMKGMIVLPQLILEIIYMVWIVKALLRTLGYLK